MKRRIKIEGLGDQEADAKSEKSRYDGIYDSEDDEDDDDLSDGDPDNIDRDDKHANILNNPLAN